LFESLPQERGIASNIGGQRANNPRLGEQKMSICSKKNKPFPQVPFYLKKAAADEQYQTPLLDVV
jgi:hypothetical protein